MCNENLRIDVTASVEIPGRWYYLSDAHIDDARTGGRGPAAVRGPRSIGGYAWTGLAVQSLLAAAATASVLAGIGRGWTYAALALAFVFPLAAGAASAYLIRDLVYRVTAAVRARAFGGTATSVIPGAPAEVRDLALSIDRLADQGDRLRATEAERGRLLAQVRSAAIGIRRHLHGEPILREAVTAIHENLAVDLAWVVTISEERLTLADTDPPARTTDITGCFPPDPVGWVRDVYRHRSSYRIEDLGATLTEEVPAEIVMTMLRQGAASLLVTPFGAARELLGCLVLFRSVQGNPWTEGEIEAVESLAGDIGRALEHARLYESEQRVVAELKSLDRARTDFLAAASHDLKTPLTSIIGYIEMLSEGAGGPVPAPAARMLGAVERSARRLEMMIEDILTISKIELGSFDPQLSPLDLSGLVPSAVELINPSATAAGLKFEVNCPDQGLIVDGDPDQLDRMLVNLLSNAVKYTPSGGHVALSVVREGDSAVLTVADTGIGIPEQDQGSLFTRFFRASNAADQGVSGTGLGLSIVATIASNHHADLSIESAQDRGTRVTVRIPLQREGPA